MLIYIIYNSHLYIVNIFIMSLSTLFNEPLLVQSMPSSMASLDILKDIVQDINNSCMFDSLHNVISFAFIFLRMQL